MEASFLKRLFAYLVDTLLISFIISLVTLIIPNDDYKKYAEEYNNLTKEYQESEMTNEKYKEYLKSSSSILYNMNKSNVIVTGTQVVLTIGYFIVLQYKMNGQTVGKKIFKIKVTENGKSPSLKAIIKRTLIIDSILSGIIGIILLYTMNKDNYYLGYLLVSSVETIFAFASALFILYRKDKMGLHDMMANTKVIEE